MWSPLIKIFQDHPVFTSQPESISDLAPLMGQIRDEASRYHVDREELPWGRYLLWEHGGGAGNLQLDIFSPAYKGAIHHHGCWGMVFILKGSLIVEDWAEGVQGFTQTRETVLTQGGCQCFCPPMSDWHRVGTPDSGCQTVTLHLYGRGFNLWEGVYLSQKMEKVRAPRGPLKDPALFGPYISHSLHRMTYSQ